MRGLELLREWQRQWQLSEADMMAYCGVTPQSDPFFLPALRGEIEVDYATVSLVTRYLRQGKETTKAELLDAYARGATTVLPPED